jgi:hypothetical protein
MKRKLLVFAFVTLLAGNVMAQQQISNSGFELWDAVGTADEEPQNWSSNVTGDLIATTPQTVFREASIKHSGSYSAKIQTTTYLLFFIVNGILTTGEVNAPSTTASQGYNETIQADSVFHATISDRPDSIVFWVNYTAGNGTDMGRVEAVIHEAYDQRVPIANDPNTDDHVIAQAQLDFGNTSGWKRKSVPFDYATFGNGNQEAYILVNFTPSNVPGAGSASSIMYVDDVELIYNPSGASITELNLALMNAWYADGNIFVRSQAVWGNDAVLTVHDMNGKLVMQQDLFDNVSSSSFGADLPNGVYVITVSAENGTTSTKLSIVR